MAYMMKVVVAAAIGLHFAAAWGPGWSASAALSPTRADSAEKIQAKADAPSPSADREKDAARFERFVNGWIASLSSQPGFEQWKKASWTSSPLGPGMHGWIVTVTARGEDAGYLVVAADEAGQFRLAEYGCGEYPLFSDHSVEIGSMAALLPSAERMYVQPFFAFWHIGGKEEAYLDAKTGEGYPVTATMIARAEKELPAPTMEGMAGAPGEVAEQWSRPSFDPFRKLNWIRHRPLPLQSPEDLTAALKQGGNMTFTVRLFDDAIQIPFPVTGYHRMADHTAYVALEQDGPRYIPFNLAAMYGDFFQ